MDIKNRPAAFLRTGRVRRYYMTEKIQIAKAMINRIPTMVQINPLPRMSFSFRFV